LEGQPKFLAMVAIGLLFKLTGQQTFTLRELTEYMNEYDGVKVIYNEAAALDESKLILTLHRKQDL
jgi:hypothetical protein